MSAIMSEAEAPKVAATAGAWLKQARQAKGLHIAALAVQLKVPQSKLEALEADRHQDLPDATFARALATAMCRALKIDATPVLALLPPSCGTTLEGVSLGLNQPFRERPTQDEGVSFEALSKPMVWGPALLLLAALLVYLLPERWTTFGPAVPERIEVPVSSQPAEPAASQVLLAPAPAVPGADLLPVQTAAKAEAGSAPAAAPASVPSAAPSGQSPLRMRASGESWVEVIDARGQVLFSRLMRAGEQADLEVATPVQLRVGNVAGTEVMLRGASVDLRSRAKDNVARLELN